MIAFLFNGREDLLVVFHLCQSMNSFSHKFDVQSNPQALPLPKQVWSITAAQPSTYVLSKLLPSSLLIIDA